MTKNHLKCPHVRLNLKILHVILQFIMATPAEKQGSKFVNRVDVMKQF